MWWIQYECVQVTGLLQCWENWLSIDVTWFQLPTRHCMRVQFVGSLLSLTRENFFPGYCGFPFSPKTSLCVQTISKTLVFHKTYPSEEPCSWWLFCINLIWKYIKIVESLLRRTHWNSLNLPGVHWSPHHPQGLLALLRFDVLEWPKCRN